MASISNLCTRSIILENGKIILNDNTEKCISKYISSQKLNFKNKINQTGDLMNLPREGSGDLLFESIYLKDENSLIISNAQLGSFLRFSIYYKLTNDKLNINDIEITIGINNSIGNRIAWFSTSVVNVEINNIPSNKGIINIDIDRLPFYPGEYSINLYSKYKGVVCDWVKDAYFFNVISNDYFGTGKLINEGQGNILINHKISIEPNIK